MAAMQIWLPTHLPAPKTALRTSRFINAEANGADYWVTLLWPCNRSPVGAWNAFACITL
ncbi:hypothetical protein HC928_26080 [bacterium]|nr:hypothetical protein [bacterium]